MGLFALLFSFKGRIRRTQFWLGQLALIMVAVVLGAVVGASVVAALKGTGLGHSGHMTPAEAQKIFMVAAGPMIALWIPMMWIGLALGAKRLHDRAKSAWWLLAFHVPGLLFWTTPALFGKSAPGIALLVAVAAVVMGLWYLIELGFLPSAPGPNPYDGAGSDVPSPLDSRPRPAEDRIVAPEFANAEAAIDRAVAALRKAPAAPAADRRTGDGMRPGGAPERRAPQGFGRRNTG